MPSFEHHGARIYYEEFGQGFPILTFAPAGLQLHGIPAARSPDRAGSGMLSTFNPHGLNHSCQSLKASGGLLAG